MNQINYELVALILITATYFGDKAACEKHQIHRKTLYNYKTRLQTDSKLAHKFLEKQKEFLEKYEEKLAQAVSCAAEYIIDVSQSADPMTKQNPEMLRAMSDALKVCGEVLLTRQVLKRRFNALDNAGDTEKDRAAGSLFGQNAESELSN